MPHGHWLLKPVSGIDIAALEFKVRTYTRPTFDINVVDNNDVL